MSTIQKPLKEAIKVLAEKYNIEYTKIEEIESAMWDFVRTEMAKGEKGELDTFENIYLRHLGTFHVRKGMVEHMKAKQDDKQT